MDGNIPRPGHLAIGEPEFEGLLAERFGHLSPSTVVFHHTTVKVVAPKRTTETKNQACQSDTRSPDASVNTNEQIHDCSKNTERLSREISRDETIKTHLEQHLIYISHCVKPDDIILNLHCFTEEQKSDIQSEKNLIKASRKAIEILLNEVSDPGRFAALRDTLDKNDSYPKIVRILDGDYDPEDQNYVKVVELFTPEIIVRIEPSELLPRLSSKGVFKQIDLEEIRAEERNHGKMRASCVLLMFLPRRAVDWFPCFLESLMECELDDIAEMLDPDHFKDIKLARQTPQGVSFKNVEQKPIKKEKPRIPPKPQLNKVKPLGNAKENFTIVTKTNEQESYSFESCAINMKVEETHKSTEETKNFETSEHTDEFIEVADVSDIKIAHLTENDCEREKFDKYMAKRDAKVIWPDKRRGKSKILLKSITKENTDHRMWNICKRNTWRRNVKEGIKQYFQQTSECTVQSNVSKIISGKNTLCTQKIRHKELCSHIHNLKIHKKQELVTENCKEPVQKWAECRMPCGRFIFIVRGSLVDIEVDVMVNTTDRHLSLSTGLAETISDRGGETIKKACARHIKSQRSIDEGEIFVTDAGNLPAKYVVHVNSPVWKEGGEDERKILSEAVMKSMLQASRKNAMSISLPAISCGISGFPYKIATETIIRAVRNFFREEQDSSLKEVYLVDVKADLLKRFREALTIVFKDDANSKIRDLLLRE